MTTGRGLWAGQPGAAGELFLGGTLFKGVGADGRSPCAGLARTKLQVHSVPG
jgi:hypothetical protein